MRQRFIDPAGILVSVYTEGVYLTMRWEVSNTPVKLVRVEMSCVEDADELAWMIAESLPSRLSVMTEEPS